MSPCTLLIDLHYLPSLEYFSRLFPYNTIQLEAQEFYQKQTYRNRCYILTSQKVDRLTVPVRKGNNKSLHRITEVDYSQPWRDVHWRALCTAYKKSPYFEYFSEPFRTIFLRRYTYLFDLNLALLQTCLALLQLEKKIILSTHYEKTPERHLVDARGSVTPHNRLGGNIYYNPVQYPQVFGKVFHPNLSIIDLLFCEGHNAYTILRQATASVNS